MALPPWQRLASSLAVTLLACGDAPAAPLPLGGGRGGASGTGGTGGATEAAPFGDASSQSDYGRCPGERDLYIRVRGDGAEQLLDGPCDALDAPYPVAAATGLAGGGDWRDPVFVIAGCAGAGGSKLALATIDSVPGVPGEHAGVAVYVGADGTRRVAANANINLTAIAPGQALHESAPLEDATYEGSFTIELDSTTTLEGELRACAITMHSQRQWVERLRVEYGVTGTSALF